MTTVCLQCFVSGRVQGVFYRRETMKRALSLGLVGFAENLPDGRVEVVICGEQEAVESLRDWLWQGPPAAKVAGVEVKEIPLNPNLTSFEMR